MTGFNPRAREGVLETVSPSGQRCLRRVARACLDYGQRVQNSVFECCLTEVEYVRLRERIKGEIDPRTDTVRFYILRRSLSGADHVLGKETSFKWKTR